jgi:flagellar hook protein FlgE
MRIDALSVAVTGITSASRRISVASHNLANIETEGFTPLQSRQSSVAPAGSEVEILRAEHPAPPDIATEIVGMNVAKLQAKASMRVIETELDLLGSLLDIKA